MAFDNEELNKRREERARRKELAQKKAKKEIIILCCVAVVLILAIAGVLIYLGISRGSTAPTEPTEPSETLAETVPSQTAPPETEPPTTIPPDTVITMVAGGDLNITDKTVSSGFTGNGYDYSHTFRDILPVLASADLTMLNLEGVFAGGPYGAASAPAELATALKNAGVDLLQTANSRAVSGGILGLTSTLNTIRQAGMEPVGTFANQSEFRKSGGFTLLEIQGIRIAVVAFTKGMDGMGIPPGQEHCVNLLYTDYNSTYQKVDTEGITSVLQAVEEESPDLTIALLHWGSEYNNQISKTQTKIISLMAQEGVDAIIGTHSHYAQQMGFDKDTGIFVAYSLGDLLSDAQRAGTEYSVLLELEITKDGATGEASITGYGYTPTYTVDETESGGSLRILRLQEAIAAYEHHALDAVSPATYSGMKTALSVLQNRLDPK